MQKVLKIYLKFRLAPDTSMQRSITALSNTALNGMYGISRYLCDYANGKRTVGCCSHIAAIIYYLAYAKYLAKIIRPAEILSRLFTADDTIAVINED